MKLLFVGDVMLGRLVNEVLKRESYKYPWGDTLTVLKRTGLRICNLECVISDVGAPWSLTQKVFHFRTDEKNVEVLKVGGIKIVSIANNHTLDYEYEALFQMRKILSDNGINFAGAGANIAEASKPTVCEVFSKEGNKKIGLIAFTDNEPGWETTETQPGIFYVPIDLADKRAKKLLEIVKKTKKSLDFLIVSAHWGPNWGYTPPPEHIPFAHALIDCGADMVFGHSAHVFRGIEIYKKRPIIYSAGDFINDYAVDEIERNNQSFIFIVEIDKENIVRLLLCPTVIKKFQARLAKGLEMEEIVSKMQKLCQQLATTTNWQEKRGELVVKI